MALTHEDSNVGLISFIISRWQYDVILLFSIRCLTHWRRCACSWLCHLMRILIRKLYVPHLRANVTLTSIVSVVGHLCFVPYSHLFKWRRLVMMQLSSSRRVGGLILDCPSITGRTLKPWLPLAGKLTCGTRVFMHMRSIRKLCESVEHVTD